MRIRIFILNRDHTLGTRKVPRGERTFGYGGGKYAVSSTAELVRRRSAEVEPMLVYREGNAVPWGITDTSEVTRFTWRRRTLEQLSGQMPGVKFPQWVKSVFNVKIFPWLIIAIALMYSILGGG